MTDTRNVVAPNLPIALDGYERRWQDQFAGVLRLYFNVLDNAINTLLNPSTLTLTDGVTAPAAVGGKAVIYVDNADGDLKIRFSDGTVKTIITD